jgi:hypothetical protein
MNNPSAMCRRIVMSFKKCHYCGWYDGNHNPVCPSSTAKNSPARKLWEQGRGDGRSGQQSASDDPVYKLGYVEGYCALEEYNNGYRPGVDGGQW